MQEKQLTVTGLTKLPESYKGESCVFTIEITDVESGKYETEIHLDEGFDPIALRDAIYESFKMCDAEVEAVHVKAFRIKHK